MAFRINCSCGMSHELIITAVSYYDKMQLKVHQKKIIKLS